jgi:hypothetical protein
MSYAHQIPDASKNSKFRFLELASTVHGIVFTARVEWFRKVKRISPGTLVVTRTSYDLVDQLDQPITLF